MQEEEVTSIVKSDRVGRTRYTAEYKSEVVAAFESSSLSGPAFARQCGIKYPTFAAWAAKGRGPDRSQNSAPPASPFIIAEIGGGNSAGSEALEVRLPGGATVLADTPRQLALLAELLKALG